MHGLMSENKLKKVNVIPASLYFDNPSFANEEKRILHIVLCEMKNCHASKISLFVRVVICELD